MNVYNNTRSPIFSGTHLMKTSVLKKTADKYIPAEAHIMEMSFSDISDARALADIKSKWVRGEYTEMITSPSYSPNRKIYAITEQKENFDNPDSDKILGVADFYMKEKNANLRFLQADPRILNQRERSVKNIGKSLMQGIVENLKGYETMDLYYADDLVKEFYKKIFPSIKQKESTMESSTNLLLHI